MLVRTSPYPLLPRQQKKLRKLYFASSSPEQKVAFAEECLRLTRQGHGVDAFFAEDGMLELFQDALQEALALFLTRKSGNLYLAVNPIYSERLYKLGATRKTPEARMRSLSTAGIPGNFILVKAWAVPDVFAAESHCALSLSSRRVQREFYEGTHSELTTAIESVVTKEWELVKSLDHTFDRSLFPTSTDSSR